MINFKNRSQVCPYIIISQIFVYNTSSNIFFGQRMLTKCAFFFRGASGGIVVVLSSLASFVASTRLIRSGIGAIDSPDQSCQGFEQYNTYEVLEKISQATFR